LTILNAVAQTLNRSVVLETALRETLAKAAELLSLHAGWIWLLHEQSGEHYLAAAQNLPPVLARNPQRMEGWCQCVEDYLEGGLAEAENIDVITCSRLKGLVEGADGLRYHASVPLHAYGRQIGILNVASADWCELSSEDLSLLYTIGDMLGIAIERARLYARSAELGAVAERNRLAREIHDTLAQGLSAISLQLETADALLDGTTPAAAVEGARRAVQQALALARANLDEARRSVLDLRAAPLEGRSLPAALAGLASDATAQSRGQVPVTLTTVGSSRPLPVRVEVGLYRVAQEAVTNALRHASPARVQVTLTATPARVQLVVKDDGQGFDPEQTPPDRYGLRGMNERVRLLGGSLHVRSAPGAGTQIEASVPLEG
jgi:two-component system NarL family sensor kinase